MSEANKPNVGQPGKWPELPSILTALQTDFSVREGAFRERHPDMGYNVGVLSDCMAFNKGHPYLSYSLPLAPGQKLPNTTPSVDFSEDGALEPCGGDTEQDDVLWMTYRLRQDEAIVLFGQTPPEADYFSYRSYLFWRFYPRESQFRRIFASLGDSINNKRINVAPPCKDVFNRKVVIVTTGNQDTYDSVCDVLKRAGVDPQIINWDKIPVQLIHMGLGQECDQFFFVNRVGNFTCEKAGQNYLANQHQTSGRVFRLTPQEKITCAPICRATNLIPRGSGNGNELELLPNLEELRKSILSQYSHLKAKELQTRVWIFEGYDAIQSGVDALGEDRDTVYLRTDPFKLRSLRDEFVIVYGVNHTKTNKAAYCNFTVYGQKVLNGVCGKSSHEPGFVGSAKELMGDLGERFYVWKIGRLSSDELYFLRVPYRIFPYKEPELSGFLNNAASIPLDEDAFVGFRAYLDPATGVGPAWWELVYDRAILFSPNV